MSPERHEGQQPGLAPHTGCLGLQLSHQLRPTQEGSQRPLLQRRAAAGHDLRSVRWGLGQYKAAADLSVLINVTKVVDKRKEESETDLFWVR